MFCQHALITYVFPTPMTSHVSFVIQCIPCSLTINGMTYDLTKLEHQAQCSLQGRINLHTCKHFCLSPSPSFLAYNLLSTLLLIMCSSLLFSNFFIKN
jgi:hypothetical protein